MILKFGMKLQRIEVYTIFINHDHGMTLTYFRTMSTLVAHAFEWGKIVKMSLERAILAVNWQMD